MKKDISEKEIIEYFLGGLSDEKADSFEESYFTDESVFELMEITEDRLVEKYVSNRLSATDKARFEKHYLVSQQRYQKVQEQKLLTEFITTYRSDYLPEPVTNVSVETRKIADKQKSFFTVIKEAFEQSFPLRLSFAAGLIAIIFMPITLLKILDLQKELGETQIKLSKAEEKKLISEEEKEQKEKERLASIGEIETLKQDLENVKKLNIGLESIKKTDTTLASTIASFLLIPGLSSRGEGQKGNELVLPQNIKTIKMQLKLDTKKTSQYKTFEIKITDIKENVVEPGKLIFVPNPNAKVLAFELPATQFNSGDYILVLNGISDSGSKVKDLDVYQFSVAVNKKSK